jgi:hypothetical protein
VRRKLCAAATSCSATPISIHTAIAKAFFDPHSNLRQHGVRILDLRNPNNGLWSHDTLMPFDNHPGPLTASTWARVMAEGLSLSA